MIISDSYKFPSSHRYRVIAYPAVAVMRHSCCRCSSVVWGPSGSVSVAFVAVRRCCSTRHSVHTWVYPPWLGYRVPSGSYAVSSCPHARRFIHCAFSHSLVISVPGSLSPSACSQRRWCVSVVVRVNERMPPEYISHLSQLSSLTASNGLCQVPIYL